MTSHLFRLPSPLTRRAEPVSSAVRPASGRAAHGAGEAFPDARYAGALAGVNFRPVFIMGDHRSGTTLLYQLLARTGLFNVVTAYHVIRYHELIDNHLRGREAEARGALADDFAARGLSSRLLDKVAVTPDLPEEYGFLFEGDRYGRARLDLRSVPRLTELCRKVCLLSGNDRPVLLKNPWDYANFRFVKAAFPEAKFLFIHRRPARVIDSQLRAARSLYESRNAYLDLLAAWYRRAFNSPLRRGLSRRFLASPLGFRVTFRHVRRVNQYFLDNISSLNACDHVSVRYEDLCSNPLAAIDVALDLGGLPARPGFDPGVKIEVRDAALLPEVEGHLVDITRELGPYLSRWGYLDA